MTDSGDGVVGELDTTIARVERLLACYGEACGLAETVHEVLDIDEPPPEPTDSGPVVGLADRFGLADYERDALALAVAPDLDSRFSHAFTELQGDRTLRRPTVDLVVECLRAAGVAQREALAAFTGSSPLVTRRLLDVRNRGVDAPFRDRIVGAQQRVLDHLLDGDGDPDDPVTVVQATESLADLPVVADTRSALEGLPAAPEERPTVHSFVGSDDAVLDRAVEATCERVGLDVVRVPAAAVLGDGDVFERALREAVLSDAALQFTAVDRAVEPAESGPGDDSSTTADSPAALLTGVEGFAGDVFLTGSDRPTPTERPDSHEFAVVEFPDPGYEHRRRLWEQRADELPEGVDPTELAGTFELSQGEIDDALSTAWALSGTHHDGITRGALYQGCKAQSSSNLEELAEPIEPGYSWDDIMLPQDTEAHLREVASHITERGTVFSQWGFEEKFSGGIGLVALFSGPSGTGKTMAAEVLANHAGLDLYRIDLSTVISKYIGETEENLERIFDEAEQSSAILLFDEADAVFGTRSEVSDSTDRYANVEVNYLLQRIESYDGVVLMTTNYESNIDDAFMRRIHMHVEFSRPDEETRELLWRELFPESTPTEGLDYEFLAGFDLSGGAIRNAAQTAAFRAASDDTGVEMSHVVPAVQRELEKTGTLIDPTSFGQYRDHLDS